MIGILKDEQLESDIQDYVEKNGMKELLELLAWLTKSEKDKWRV